jgi:hypothetical protein
MTNVTSTTEINGFRVLDGGTAATCPFTKEQARNELHSLAKERADWEANEFASSRKRLYSLLTRCYAFYRTMTSEAEKAVRQELRAGLDTVVSEKGYIFKSTTSPMNKIVQVVFGTNSRRVSAYALTLRAALTAMPDGKPVEVVQLAQWIENAGGVEEIRQGSKSKGVKPSQRVELAKSYISDVSRHVVKLDAKSFPISSDCADKLVVLIGTYRPTGDVELSGVVTASSAVNAALQAYYAENKQLVDAATVPEKSSATTAVAAALQCAAVA